MLFSLDAEKSGWGISAVVMYHYPLCTISKSDATSIVYIGIMVGQLFSVENPNEG